MYQLFIQLRGTVAINIFVGLFSIYLLWLLVKALDMKLLSSILGQFIGVGVIALIIVFQQEIRKFLLFIGTRYLRNYSLSIENFFNFKLTPTSTKKIDEITEACISMSSSKTGALIVLSSKDSLDQFTSTGEKLNAEISTGLIESIFFKNSPLHDGAAIFLGNKILAARCILPVSDRSDIPARMGTRHRAAIGISEVSTTVVIVVSEETGSISWVEKGEIATIEKQEDLKSKIHKALI